MTAKYNILFNGTEALNRGIEDLNTNYADDFDALLPVEPMKERVADDNVLMPDQEKLKTKTDFDIAEEKAVKAVQKHSMSIGNIEYNKQIDDAYFLLAKARYYSQRFVPALEAFNFMLNGDPSRKMFNDIKIWKAKTLIRLQNEVVGIKELNDILKKEEDLKANHIEQAHTSLAMGYMAQKDWDKTMEHLKKAIETNVNKDQQARNIFILGQLYEKKVHKDSAVMVYQRLVELKKIPQKYKVHAYLKLADLDNDTLNNEYYIGRLKKMLKNPLGKSYFDEIYFGLSGMAFNRGEDEQALEYLHKSLRVTGADQRQKVKSYQRLGDYYFDRSAFVKAGMYYDSLVPLIKDSNKKKMLQLLRKHENLKDVVLYEGVVTKNDSILRLVNMDKPARESYFKDYIEELKKADKLAEELKQRKSGNFGLPSLKNNTNANANNNGVWYFYNAQAVGFGQTEFRSVWGDRPLKNNWRWSQKTLSDQPEDMDNQDENIAGADKKYNLDYYLSTVPSDPKAIGKIKQELSKANYQLGLIYKEKFKEYKLAKKKLERFLNESPIQNHILPARYHLYWVYKELGDPQAQRLYDDIVANHPNSRYADLLQNKTSETADESSPEQRYEEVYKHYEDKQYDQVISECETAVAQYAGTTIHPKFELLKAYAQYYKSGKPEFIKSLEYIVLNFPKTPEGQHAQKVLDRLTGKVGKIKNKPPKPKRQKTKAVSNKTRQSSRSQIKK